MDGTRKLDRSDAAARHREPAPRLFDVAQARQTLPLVRRIVADVVAAFTQFQAASAARSEPGRQAATDRLEALVAELAEIGCGLKDWRLGLVDFLAPYDGRHVELCWRHGEESITTWHEIGAGFPGRQDITPAFEDAVHRAWAEQARGGPATAAAGG